jgi:hypothetical protein
MREAGTVRGGHSQLGCGVRFKRHGVCVCVCVCVVEREKIFKERAC